MKGATQIRRQHGFPEPKNLGEEILKVSRWEITLSLAIPWVCFTIYILAAIAGWWPLAVFATVLLSFFTYGSISHDLVHNNLGLPRRLNTWLLTATELLAFRSGHTYRAAHLHHHARFPSEDDIEGAASGMSFMRAILEGIILQPRLWLWAIRRGGPYKHRIFAEGLACISLLGLCFITLSWSPILITYAALMIMGSWIIPLMTSYIPHNKHADQPLQQTKRFRGFLFSLLAIEHLYHVEHHLYPQVPHHRWKALAKKLDPYFDRAGITPIKLGSTTEDRRDANQ